MPYPLGTVPSQRYRLEQWAPELGRHGVQVSFCPFADPALMGLLYRPGRVLAKTKLVLAGFARRVASLRRVREYDAVVIHRTLNLVGPATLERVLARLGRPIVFDFDDAIFLLDTADANRALGWLKFPQKTDAICRLSTHVVVSNETLAAYARRHSRRVSIVPSSVDTERYAPVQKPHARDRFVVGWTGSATSQAYLESFAPVLVRILAAAGPGAELHVHSDLRPRLPGVAFTWLEWSPDSEVDVWSRFDVGIMPVDDDPWARGKSAMKALLYMAMGIPAICSPVGVAADLIRSRENGFLASTPEEWVAVVKELAGDPQLRARIGTAGRATVERLYSHTRSAALFADVMRESVKR